VVISPLIRCKKPGVVRYVDARFKHQTLDVLVKLFEPQEHRKQQRYDDSSIGDKMYTYDAHHNHFNINILYDLYIGNGLFLEMFHV